MLEAEVRGDAVFTNEELQRLREFPEISREELFRYFTLTPADLAFVAPQGRGPAVRLGLAVALCTLPWLGFVPDKVPSRRRWRWPDWRIS